MQGDFELLGYHFNFPPSRIEADAGVHGRAQQLAEL
jgi:hypothetical protein